MTTIRTVIRFFLCSLLSVLVVYAIVMWPSEVGDSTGCERPDYKEWQATHPYGTFFERQSTDLAWIATCPFGR